MTRKGSSRSCLRTPGPARPGGWAVGFLLRVSAGWTARKLGDSAGWTARTLGDSAGWAARPARKLADSGFGIGGTRTVAASAFEADGAAPDIDTPREMPLWTVSVDR